jgi:hypothetical protein
MASVVYKAGGIGAPGGNSIKTQNIESISATKTLLLDDDYFQFLTPTVASVVVKLPTAGGSDYFECEIVNISTTNAIEVQEPDNTPIVTLENDGDLARSVYAYWDGATWQVWIRGYY